MFRISHTVILILVINYNYNRSKCFSSSFITETLNGDEDSEHSMGIKKFMKTACITL